MTRYAEIPLADGTPIRLELAAVGEAAEPSAQHGPDGSAGNGGTGGGTAGGTGGIRGVTPVSRNRPVSAVVAAGWRTVLGPLGPLLDEVHDAVVAGQNPPDEINVQFGVEVGHDLRLGIVGGRGQASLTVSATWRPAEAARRSGGGSAG